MPSPPNHSNAMRLSWFSKPVAAIGLIVGALAPEAGWAQAGPNVIRDIRPLVNISLVNPHPTGDLLALGIFDTGDDSVFIPPDTNAYFGIGQAFPVPPAPGNPLVNYGAVGNPITLTVGGWLGVAAGGPEVHTPPPPPGMPAGALAHIYSTDSRRASMQAVTEGGIAPSLTYFNAVGNNRFSEPNIGTVFVGGTATSSPLVAEVDPTNATYLPFASGNSNQAGIRPAVKPLDQTSSSISFFMANSGQVPTAALNADPGFLLPLTMNPDNTVAAPGFTRINVAGNNGATAANRPRITLGPGGDPNHLGVANGIYLVDTGAPDTDPAGPGHRGRLGTNITDGYGQYFDFSRNSLLLFGPQRQSDKALIGPGILFNVDHSTQGLSRTGVNQMQQFGIPPILTAAGPGNPNGEPLTLQSLAPEQSSAIFKTDVTHSNAVYISGVGALDLHDTDQLDGLSLGADPINRHPTLYFSVDRASTGIAGAGTGFGHGVDGQAARGQAAADIFESKTGVPAPVRGTNQLRFNQDLLGLGNNVGPTNNAAAGRGNNDNLNDFDLQTIRGYVGPTEAQVQRNIDPPILHPGDDFNPGAGVAGNHGVRGDIYGSNFDTYFTLHQDSPSLVGFSAADLLVNNPASSTGSNRGFHVFAPFTTIGQQQNDAIDAFALDRPILPLDGPLFEGPNLISPDLIDDVYDPNHDAMFDGIDPFHDAGIADLAIFSLAPGSPSLGIFDPFLDRDLSPADIFITDFDTTFALFASAQSLGLNPFRDNVDGLDIIATPEPGAISIFVAAVAALVACRRRRRAARPS